MWCRHPSYLAARDRLVQAIIGPTFRFRPLGHVVFLCGAWKSENREALKAYLADQRDPLVEIFYAEDVWNQLVSHAGSNAAGQRVSALELERRLARLSDVVIILVESPGTFAELGAFSIADDLRSKLLPVLDARYKQELSFLNTGPVRWVNADSRFAPVVQADFARILLAADEIRDRLTRLPAPKHELITSLAVNRKHLLFFSIDLVTIMGPVSIDMVHDVIRAAEPSVEEHDVELLLMLARAVGYLDYREDSVGHRYYYRKSGWSSAFASRKYLSIGRERASFVSALLQIPEAAAMLQKCR